MVSFLIEQILSSKWLLLVLHGHGAHTTVKAPGAFYNNKIPAIGLRLTSSHIPPIMSRRITQKFSNCMQYENAALYNGRRSCADGDGIEKTRVFCCCGERRGLQLLSCERHCYLKPAKATWNSCKLNICSIRNGTTSLLHTVVPSLQPTHAFHLHILPLFHASAFLPGRMKNSERTQPFAITQLTRESPPPECRWTHRCKSPSPNTFKMARTNPSG